MVSVQIKKVVAYCRVSSESQIDNTSIEEQLKKITAYCTSQDLELIRIFKDEGKTGKNTDRKEYEEMMKYIKNPDNQVSGIVVLKADRIHRRLKNLLIMIEDVLEPTGIAFISVSERFDTSTAQGMLFLQMIGSFAEFERAVINERTKGGRIATAKQNKYAGGQVPYGYEVINGVIHVNEQQSPIVKRVFSEFAEGDGMYRIAKRLNQEGVSTKSGKGKWTLQHIKNMLHSEVYTGVSSYDGKKENNKIRQKDVFPKIISRQMWNKVNKVVEKL